MLSLMVGASGSGKTTFCRYKLCSFYTNFIYLSSDTFRSVIGASEEDQSVSGRVFDILEANVRYFCKLYKQEDVQGWTRYTHVILDATNTTPASRKRFIQAARDFNVKVTAYFFDTSLETIKKRNAARSRKVPEDVILRQFSKLTIPNASEVDCLYIVGEDGNVRQEF